MKDLISKSNKDLDTFGQKEGLRVGTFWILKSSRHYNSERVFRITKIEDEVIHLARNTTWEFDKWEDYTKMNRKELFSSYDRTAHPQEMLDVAQVILSTGDFSAYKDNSPEQVDVNHALVGRNSKEYLSVVQSRLEESENTLRIITRFVEIEMERRRSHLEVVFNQMTKELAKFKRKIIRIMRVIDSIELYLGIHEDLFQIQEGEKAPDEEPLYLWQRVLFMDEEMALTVFDADYTDVKEFDEWLIRKDRYKMLCPSQKGIVVFKPRRTKKKYDDNPWINAQINVPNFETYFLIRNGENLYRIQTNLSIPDRLFPAQKDLADFWDKVNKELDRYEEVRESTEDEIHFMKKRAIFLQGIVHRTSIFPELADVKFFELENHKGRIIFVYDDEPGYLLTSGIKPFRQWLLEINKKAKRGTRIIIPEDYEYKDDSRFLKYYNEYSMPPGPEAGLYYLEEYKETWRRQGATFCIRYVPNAEYWSWSEGSKEYKNRIRFFIYDDDFNWLFINYDMLDIETIDYYLNSRLDRKEYFRLVPTLVEARKELVKELAEQDQFAKLIKRDAQRKWKREISLQEVNEAIEWWKRKVIYKRPITKDTPKAYRMIITHLNITNDI